MDAKVVTRGKVVELLCKCIHMDDYGRDAVDLKHAFDDTMKDTYKIPLDRFVNFLCVQMGQVLIWAFTLVRVHKLKTMVEIGF